MANSADPDQLASSEANWSGSTLFERQGISRFSRTRVNILFISKLKTNERKQNKLTTELDGGLDDVENVSDLM